MEKLKEGTMFVIKVDNWWFASWEGDPGRTLVLNSAKIYESDIQAKRALKKAKKLYPNRDISKAEVVEIFITEKINTKCEVRVEKEILEAPCQHCGYNGEGYWQKGTHHKECPWYNVAGMSERENLLLNIDSVLHEKRYIDITDLQKVRNAYSILREICPGKPSKIEKEEYLSVMQVLNRWIDRY